MVFFGLAVIIIHEGKSPVNVWHIYTQLQKKKSGSAKVANFLAINLPVFISGYVTNHLSPTFKYFD